MKQFRKAAIHQDASVSMCGSFFFLHACAFVMKNFDLLRKFEELIEG